MRLGKDAIVFTRQRDTMSVGFLSQTFLNTIKADSVVVPIVSYDTKSRILSENVTNTLIDPGCSIRVETLGNFEGKSKLLRQI